LNEVKEDKELAKSGIPKGRRGTSESASAKVSAGGRFMKEPFIS